MHSQAFPASLGPEFSTSRAREAGVTWGRLRSKGLESPFHGVRTITHDCPAPTSPFEAARERELTLIRALSTRLTVGQFFAHRSAALLWGAPVPYRDYPDLHLGSLYPRRSPRVRGVTGHGFTPERVEVTWLGGSALLSPASTFVTLGDLPLPDLVAVGDYFAREHRPGVGRPHVGQLPLSTIGEMASAVNLGRWPGMKQLREALALVREDAWSPRESMLRVTLVQAGLPEPELNVDLFDEQGYFLGCVDMVYRRWRLVVEYQGELHAASYAQDVERVERLRAAGWTVLQVTKELARHPAELAERVARALMRAGWCA